jgi:hypothetical protein
VVVKAAPHAPFVIAQAEFLLEFLVVALDPLEQLGQVVHHDVRRYYDIYVRMTNRDPHELRTEARIDAVIVG